MVSSGLLSDAKKDLELPKAVDLPENNYTDPPIWFMDYLVFKGLNR